MRYPERHCSPRPRDPSTAIRRRAGLGKFHKEMAQSGVRLSGRAQRGPSPGRRAGAPPSPRGEGGGEIGARKKGVQSLHVE